MPAFTLPMPRHLDASSFRQHLLNNVDTFIFDADGVLWLGEQSIRGSSDFIDFLAEHGKQIIVLTNNATKSRAVYARKLSQLGFGRCITENEECLFVATNEDETCPGPNPETVIPDAGPLVAAVRTASGRDPQVVGKPNTPAFDYICRR